MSAAHFEGSFLGDADRITSETKLECGVCWWVYDPAVGDDVWQIPPGVAFADLPKDWRCPHCDAAQRQFMVLDAAQPRPARPERAAGALAMDHRLADLAAAYGRVDAQMRALPVHNARLGVELVGFRRWEDCYLGVVVTPWCMNLTRLPLNADVEGPPEGATRRRALPSGTYAFISGRLEGVGALETCSLFSPMEAFDDPAVARLVARHAIEGACAAPEPASPETREERTSHPAAAASRAAQTQAAPSVSRRRFLGGTSAAP